MNRLVLFGAGLAAPPTIETARSQGQIVAIADNDPAKWSQSLLGLPIVPPREIPDLAPDQIIISSTATFPIYQQLLELGIAPNKIHAPLLSSANRGKWTATKNAHLGKRIFIIGNGPSLQISDLDRIHQNGDLSFAFNKIYLSFAETQFRPDYYLVEDDLVAKNNADTIRYLTGFQKFYPDYLLPVLGTPDQETTLFYFDVQHPDRYQARFSTEPFQIHSGYSCTYSALQLAMRMGFSDIIFIGLDFSFTLPNQANGEVLTNENERNHFSPEYRAPGESWNRPYLDQTRQAYQLAKQIADNRGITILNASRHSQLDVFPRADFDSLFNKK